MEISGRIARQILLFSLLVLVVSMVMFPKKYGTDLPDAPLVNVGAELVFYGLVIHLLNRKLLPLQLVSSAGLCLVYRFALGAILGILIAIVYEWQLKVALLAGMGSYLPGMLLQVVATPFILRPVIRSLHSPRATGRSSGARMQPQDSSTSTTPVTASKQRSFSETGRAGSADSGRLMAFEGSTAGSTTAGVDSNGFEKATRYIGEDGSVLMAAVVDNEGLLLGNFCRRGIDAEKWAPFSLLLVEQNRQTMMKLGCDTPEKIDMFLEDKKIVVAREEAYCLMVLAERSTDDVLNIRINQGLEIVRKYVAERYSDKLIGNVEKTYV